MEIYDNTIRAKCEESMDFLKEIEKFSQNKNALFFIQELRNTIIEITYTSDEWFLNINNVSDRNKRLVNKLEHSHKTINELNNDFDDMAGKEKRFSHHNREE